MLLNQLSTNGTGTIAAIHAGQDMRRRLAGLGMRLGIRVKVIRLSPLEGPMQIRVGSTDLILRRSDAAHIEIDAQTA
jgi:ferrous iron transport protein A